MRRNGYSLVELMVATALLAILSLGVVQGLRWGGLGSETFRNKTHAMTIARDHLQELRGGTFLRVYVSSFTLPIPLLPDLDYDPVHYPPEPTSRGATVFPRYSKVEKAR